LSKGAEASALATYGTGIEFPLHAPSVASPHIRQTAASRYQMQRKNRIEDKDTDR